MQEQPNLVQKQDIKENPRLVLDMVSAIQNYAKEEYQVLDALKRDLEEGKTISIYEISCLIDRYERLYDKEKQRQKILWTIDVINRLQDAKIGNREILDVMKHSLEEGRALDQSEIRYIKENWRLLPKVVQEKNQLVVNQVTGSQTQTQRTS
jgi:hypothetical protein